MAELTDVLHEFVTRYRTRVLAKAGILGTLSFAALAVLGWRLRGLHVSPGWSVGLPVGLACGVTVSLAWWVRQHWFSPHSAAAHLDDVLGLQQRLVTAEEFARSQQPPALYPLLVEDTARRCSPQQTRFPRPLDRTAGALVVLLLFLLLWPRLGSGPFQLPPHPQSRPPQPPLSQETSPQDRHQDEQRQQQGSSAQQASSSNQSEPNAGTGQSQQPNDGQQGSTNAEGSRSNTSSGSDAANTRAGESKSGAQQQDASGQEANGQQAKGNPQQTEGRSGQSGETKSQSAAGHKQQAEGQSVRSSGAGQQHAAQGAQRSTAQERESGRSAEGQKDRASQTAQQRAAQGGGGQSPGNDEALKAEIQQLLKEVSGELKDLQAQMASKANQVPEAGTSSDPNLYESPMKLDRTTGDALPIQLKTDSAQIKGQRPGSGVGQPSGDVGSATPQTHAEAAQLADTPREETPTSRQPVPPEYRSIFDQLRRSSAQPSETKQ